MLLSLSSSSLLLYFISYVAFEQRLDNIFVQVNASFVIVKNYASLAILCTRTNCRQTTTKASYINFNLLSSLNDPIGSNRNHLPQRTCRSHLRSNSDDYHGSYNGKYSRIIDSHSILNLEQNNGNNANDTLTFAKSLLIEGTVIGGKLQCTGTETDTDTYCNDNDQNDTNQNDSENDNDDTFIKIGLEGELRTADLENVVTNIEILGKLVGNVHCNSLYVGKKAVVIGNVKARSIRIEQGATVIGSITCDVETIPKVKIQNVELSNQLVESNNRQSNDNCNSVDDYGRDMNEKSNLSNVNGGKQQDKDDKNWVSTDIGYFIDESRNLVVPITTSNALKDAVTTVPMKVIHTHNGSINNSSDNSSEGENLSEMMDDFGNSLLPQREKSKQKNEVSLLSNKEFSDSKYHDEFGNPLIRGADENEIAGYRQIREMSAVTRQILDNHINEKKKQAIASRLSHRHLNSNKQADNVDSDDDIPSFLK